MRRSSRFMLRRGIPAVVALAALVVAGCGGDDAGSASASGEDGDGARVGVFSITNDALLDDVIAGFKEQFLADTGLDDSQVEWVEENAQGDNSLIQSIARQLAEDDGLDMIAVIGTPAVVALAEQEAETPIIALAMGDPVGAGVAESLDAPGGNVTGSIDYIEPADVLAELAKVSPAPTRLGTVYDPSNQNMEVWVGDLREAVEEDPEMSLEEASIASSSDVSAAARSLDGRADALLIGPDAAVISALPAVGEAVMAAGQALYLVGGDPETPGVVATLGPDYPELGRGAGSAAAEVHNGTPPGEVPFARPGAIEWGVNPTTAADLGITLPAGAGG